MRYVAPIQYHISIIQYIYIYMYVVYVALMFGEQHRQVCSIIMFVRNYVCMYVYIYIYIYIY